MPECFFIPTLRQNRHSKQRNIQAYIAHRFMHARMYAHINSPLNSNRSLHLSQKNCTHLTFISYNNLNLSMILAFRRNAQ